MSESYDEILRRAKSLSKEEQIRLLVALTESTGRRNGDQSHSITDLKGLGKEIWKGVNPDEYVAGERDTWDG